MGLLLSLKQLDNEHVGSVLQSLSWLVVDCRIWVQRDCRVSSSTFSFENVCRHARQVCSLFIVIQHCCELKTRLCDLLLTCRQISKPQQTVEKIWVQRDCRVSSSNLSFENVFRHTRQVCSLFIVIRHCCELETRLCDLFLLCRLISKPQQTVERLWLFLFLQLPF